MAPPSRLGAVVVLLFAGWFAVLAASQCDALSAAEPVHHTPHPQVAAETPETTDLQVVLDPGHTEPAGHAPREFLASAILPRINFSTATVLFALVSIVAVVFVHTAPPLLLVRGPPGRPSHRPAGRALLTALCIDRS